MSRAKARKRIARVRVMQRRERVSLFVMMGGTAVVTLLATSALSFTAYAIIQWVAFDFEWHRYWLSVMAIAVPSVLTVAGIGTLLLFYIPKLRLGISDRRAMAMIEKQILQDFQMIGSK